jgi:hypothetical protein
MQQIRKASEAALEQTPAQPGFRRALVSRRTELEATLLAHQCGWRELDEVRLRRVRLSLHSVLEALGKRDPAEALIRVN